jgi:hypothetical protein
MIYLKKLEFPKNLTQLEFETTLRKYALNHKSPLDFTFKPINIGTEKIFYGQANTSNVQFTRIKTSFEFFLPKIILNVSTDPMSTFYKLRIGALPMGLAAMLLFALLTGFINIIRGQTTVIILLPFFIMAVILILLIKLEIKLTMKSVKKAVS